MAETLKPGEEYANWKAPEGVDENDKKEVKKESSEENDESKVENQEQKTIEQLVEKFSEATKKLDNWRFGGDQDRNETVSKSNMLAHFSRGELNHLQPDAYQMPRFNEKIWQENLATYQEVVDIITGPMDERFQRQLRAYNNQNPRYHQIIEAGQAEQVARAEQRLSALYLKRAETVARQYSGEEKYQQALQAAKKIATDELPTTKRTEKMCESWSQIAHRTPPGGIVYIGLNFPQ